MRIEFEKRKSKCVIGTLLTVLFLIIGFLCGGSFKALVVLSETAENSV